LEQYEHVQFAFDLSIFKRLDSDSKSLSLKFKR
jgi:hypothetical protein